MSQVLTLDEYKYIVEREKGTIAEKIFPWRYMPLYSWQEDFLFDVNRSKILCGGNQSGKTTIELILGEMILADPLFQRYHFGEKLVDARGFYLYPNTETVLESFEDKWLPLLPQGKYKDPKVNPLTGWELEKEKRVPKRLYFANGSRMSFKTYTQKPEHLQSGTLYFVGCDEELPPVIFDELSRRRSATEGFMTMAFTATIGYEEYYRAMERIGKKDEYLPEFWKRCVSLYECVEHTDGTPGKWNLAKIEETKKKCSNEREIEKRVYGRCIKEDGLLINGFEKRMINKIVESVPNDWVYQVGIDYGRGGDGRSKSAIVIVARNKECTKARVVRSWIGDYKETVPTDVVEEYISMIKKLKIDESRVAGVFYDAANPEIEIAARRKFGLTFYPAVKKRNEGWSTISDLFFNDVLTIDESDDDAEGADNANRKLIYQIITTSDKVEQSLAIKRKFPTDLIDALRYCLYPYPSWNYKKQEIKKAGVVKTKDKRDHMIDSSIKRGTDEDIQRSEGLKRFMKRKRIETDTDTDDLSFWVNTYNENM